MGISDLHVTLKDRKRRLTDPGKRCYPAASHRDLARRVVHPERGVHERVADPKAPRKLDVPGVQVLDRHGIEDRRLRAFEHAVAKGREDVARDVHAAHDIGRCAIDEAHVLEHRPHLVRAGDQPQHAHIHRAVAEHDSGVAVSRREAEEA